MIFLFYFSLIRPVNALRNAINKILNRIELCLVSELLFHEEKYQLIQ